MLQPIFKKIVSGIAVCIVVAAAFVTFAPSFSNVAHAASLSLYPATTKVSVGNIISMKILVGTDGKSVNTANATIQFPTDLLEVMSISKDSSIFSLWVEDPAFSNTLGTITFDGGVPTPGYVGQSGEILSVVFRAKKQGTASIVFSGDSSVLANDGLGTDILSATQLATLTINSSGLEVPVVNTSANSLPIRPIITSLTQPDQNAWYSATSASFNWTIPNDVTSIQTLLSKDPNAIPTVTYDSSVSQRTVSNLTDGVLYFHLRYMNSVGWGPVATYKVQLDSTPPEKFALDVQTQNIQNVVTLNAVDAMSGISSYSVQIDSTSPIRIDQTSLVNNQYFLPIQNQGKHSLVVLAYDKAGNSTESDTTYTSPAIIPPTIAIYPVSAANQAAGIISTAEVRRGDMVRITGQTQYPNTQIAVFVQPEGKEIKKYVTTTNADGSYTLLSDPFDVAGLVDAWSQLVFSDSVQSPLSNKVNIHVDDGLIVQTSKSVIYGLSFIIPAIVLVLALGFALYLGWHEFFGLRRRLRKEVQETMGDAHRALMIFKEELGSQLGKLEKIKEGRDLNKKEEKIFKELQGNIDSIDDFIEKKLKKIR